MEELRDLLKYKEWLQKGNFGSWKPCEKISDRHFIFGYALLNDETLAFVEFFYKFVESYKDGLIRRLYCSGAIRKLQINDLLMWDENMTLGYLLKIFRDDRFCEGALLEALNNGTVLKLVLHLEEITKGS